MRIVQSVIAVIVIGLTLIGFQEITCAQVPQPAPNHVHYSEPAQQSQPSPTGALAPRLQSLGSHRFPVTTKNRQAQLDQLKAQFKAHRGPRRGEGGPRDNE